MVGQNEDLVAILDPWGVAQEGVAPGYDDGASVRLCVCLFESTRQSNS